MEKISDQTKNRIIEIVETQKPQTTAELIRLVKTTEHLSEKQITQIILQLENEGRVHFEDIKTFTTMKEYLLSSNAWWYWATLALAVTTVISYVVIPENVYPMSYITTAFGLVFASFLPGFSFIKALYPSKKLLTSNEMDAAVRLLFSVSLSLVFVPLVALILNYTSWGVSLIPLSIILLALTLSFATVAIIREFRLILAIQKPSISKTA
jgi:uncharacterized membrane protein